MKKISILGSTGSIGTQAIEIIRNNDDLELVALSCNNNIELAIEQIEELSPKYVAVYREDKAIELKKRLKTKCEVLTGIEGLITIATLPEVDILLTSVVGNIGLRPTYEAVKLGKTIALANKETLVTSGEIIMKLARTHGAKILPVDSEHSALFQCLQGNELTSIEKLILTASGGPFRGKTLDQLENISIKDALNHPNWSMGKKITIDSATMMNKGLEVIEAKWLFDIDIEDIDVIVHPQSIIHSMIQYKDGSVMAQMGLPDMKLPIHYAFYYPDRKWTGFERMDLSKIAQLTFEKPDMKTFRCLQLAYDALKAGGTLPTVMNASNEVLVDAFLNERIGFLDIAKYIEEAMENHSIIKKPTIDDILEIDMATRRITEEIIGG